MKTCVLLSGRIKTWQKNYESLKQSLINYDYDIFASLNTTDTDPDAIEFSELENVKDVICSETVYPKWYENVNFYSIDSSKNSLYSQCYHRMLVFTESRNFSIYDRYIFTRADLITQDSIPLIAPLDKNIYCPKINMHGLECKIIGEHKVFQNNDVPLINDQILVCNYDAASTVAGLFYELHNMYFYKNIWWHPETMLHEYLKTRNFEINNFDFSYILDPERKKSV